MYKSCKEILDRLENEGVRVNHGFEFPEPVPLEKKLKDVLEKEVDEKYYLSDKQIAGIKHDSDNQKAKGYGFQFKPRTLDDYATCISTRAGQRKTDNFIKVVGNLDIKGQDQIKRVYDSNGISPTLSTMQGGNRQPKIIDDTYGDNDESREHEGRSPTLRSGGQGLKVAEPYRIRKLTPRECYRLMGFDDESFDKASKVISSTQLYKTAGNSIVVDVLMAIFKELFKDGS